MTLFAKLLLLEEKLFQLKSDIVCNSLIAACIMDMQRFVINVDHKKISDTMNIYVIGTFNGYAISVDPTMKFNDYKIFDSCRLQIHEFTQNEIEDIL